MEPDCPQEPEPQFNQGFWEMGQKNGKKMEEIGKDMVLEFEFEHLHGFGSRINHDLLA